MSLLGARSTITDKMEDIYSTDGRLHTDAPTAMKVTVADATTTYIGSATPGTAQATAAWSCKKIVVSGGTTTITWADSGKFTQVATDLTALTYA